MRDCGARLRTSVAERWIVTAATESFIPGAKALYNSAARWCPGVKFGILFYTDWPGRWTVQKVQDQVGADAVVYINHPVPMGDDLGKKYNSFLTIGPEMYSRLLIPLLFSGRAFYLDADCLILQAIDELWTMDLKGRPSACVDRGDVGWRNDQVAMASGTVLIDCAEWNRRGLVEQCLELQLAEGLTNNVEGLISIAHGDEFLRLNPIWQNLAYFGCLCREDKIIHYAGYKPWLTEVHGWWVNYLSIWQAYYDNDMVEADQYIPRIPPKRPADPYRNKANKLNKGW